MGWSSAWAAIMRQQSRASSSTLGRLLTGAPPSASTCGGGGVRGMSSWYMNRSFPRSNSSFFLSSGNALTSQVVRLREDAFLVDAGSGTPRVCMQHELTTLPRASANRRRFEDTAGYAAPGGGESGGVVIKKHVLERFFMDLVAGDSFAKEQAAARVNDMVGSPASSSSALVLPRRFRQGRAWMELNNICRNKTKVKGILLKKKRGGFSVGIAGFIAFLPNRRSILRRGKSNARFTIETIKPKSRNIVLL